jgi:hypothetical protein
LHLPKRKDKWLQALKAFIAKAVPAANLLFGTLPWFEFYFEFSPASRRAGEVVSRFHKYLLEPENLLLVIIVATQASLALAGWASFAYDFIFRGTVNASIKPSGA